MIAGLNKVLVYDTTLRDGEQSPGASMNAKDKLRMARQLEKLGVDVIEAGFPAASPGEFNAVREIAKCIEKPEIAAIARASFKDIDLAWDAIRYAGKPRLHVFLSSSAIHRTAQLMKNKDEILQKASEAVRYASSLTDNVEFSAMDASRTEKKFLCRLFESAIRAGAKTVNIADTVGFATPDEFGSLVAFTLKHVSGPTGTILSVHCHDDLGLAVANTLAAVKNGASQVKCTINGIGERAGNAALEEVVVAMARRKSYYRAKTNVRMKLLYTTSQLLTHLTGIAVQPNKAVVGANAFAHESGIHQDGLLKNRNTYEILRPKSVGSPGTRLIFGKHSGRHAIEDYLRKKGYVLTPDILNATVYDFKNLSESVSKIDAEDLEAIYCRNFCTIDDVYQLISIQVATVSDSRYSATMNLRTNGQIRNLKAFGGSAVGSVLSALRKLTGKGRSLIEYSGHMKIMKGVAQGEAVVRLRYHGMTTLGRSVHLDMPTAAAHAYIDALNTLERMVASGFDKRGTGMKLTSGILVESET
ncbi:MAG TPA: 2-isopropylmalate synthase [Syntrophorhabdaceae bacterium]|nr:2-isopropylmalate synthase [Syntrophorhabdaceae bacterium]